MLAAVSMCASKSASGAAVEMMGNKKNRVKIGAPWNLYGFQSETRLFISEDSYGFQSRGEKSHESYGGQSALGRAISRHCSAQGGDASFRGCKLSVRCSKRVHTLRVAFIGYVWSTQKNPTASLLAAVSMCVSKSVASMCASNSVMQISAQIGVHTHGFEQKLCQAANQNVLFSVPRFVSPFLTELAPLRRAHPLTRKTIDAPKLMLTRNWRRCQLYKMEGRRDDGKQKKPNRNRRTLEFVWWSVRNPSFHF